ncbi:MAG: hypothetical protein A2991_00125 [Candidatus Terrybacteria bacterium RIFCSPLOWO2_01_FULL_58_14]|uniref:Uncharacterized protein n=2 Tax=Candidatus Terryibacteriota TaxID=1817920 RepID=A0A1G2Q057_9BACT|nr:MAG: hypothetical protein A2682_01100 [Candidatus Terrybacteria bacterium RIFCSPHIGHO2_01_FULL_58_15]OHA53399.1 MAG: hypothetical protein A2991_00125 [Candidatus Terrybacteria bacterium RIFCSPLOWO2_01_FULL_58_14]
MSNLISALGSLFVLAAVLGLVLYGVGWIAGGSQMANAYLRFLRRALTSLGRTVGAFCRRYPLAAGIIALVVILALAF